MDDLRPGRTALEAAARTFDPSACSGQDAIDLLAELGVQRRLIDGLIAKATKRVDDTAAHTYGTDRSSMAGALVRWPPPLGTLIEASHDASCIGDVAEKVRHHR